ncbi:hypothetical protein [Mycolicibacterium goodii]|uniref:hypothetical protein n=1 Tax=Mycolicibacterium goodii TaxID=134601 RepID=UPI001BDCBE9F|nr:hypothetical protein [Mycolicibacterium goodii]MBU8830850.1 hypothetical protein [Mycolicibacterium goodii]
MYHHQQWPWPEDTREDRAKRIAVSFRQLLLQVAGGQVIDPAGALRNLTQQWLQYEGTGWLIPTFDPYDNDDWVNATDAAHYANVDPKTIRKWAERGHIRVDHDPTGTPLYNIGDMRAYDARKKRARIQRAVNN